MPERPSKWPGSHLVHFAFSGVGHCGIMWALDFLLCFLIHLAAQVDSSGERQGSAYDTISLLVVGQVWEETVTGE